MTLGASDVVSGRTSSMRRKRCRLRETERPRRCASAAAVRIRGSNAAVPRWRLLRGRSGLHSVVGRVGARARRRRKAGNAPLANLGVKPADHHVEGSWLVTKPRGDLGQRASLHEESSQYFVTAVEREFGIDKEAMSESKIQDARSHPLTVFYPRYGRVYLPTATPTKLSPESSALRYAGAKDSSRADTPLSPLGFRVKNPRSKHAKNDSRNSGGRAGFSADFGVETPKLSIIFLAAEIRVQETSSVLNSLIGGSDRRISPVKNQQLY
jgi:hypothetical protein